MKNVMSKINVPFVLAMALMAVFMAAGSFPAYAHADYYYGGGYYYSPSSYNAQPIAYNYYTTPTYYYQQPAYSYPALTASCYPTSSSVSTGSSVQWVANASGGTGSYSYNWSGTDGLNGYGSSAFMTYYNQGYKTASVMITSGNQTANVSCGNGVNVYGQYYNSYPYNYNNYGYPVSVVCSANTTNSPVGATVTWNAYVSNGNTGYYVYNWAGTDGLGAYGNDNSPSVSYTYTTPGVKTAQVTISGGGQTITQNCSNSVSVGGSAIIGTPVPVGSSGAGLQIGCYADPSSAKLDQPVTWNVEVTGGAAPYKYSWTGTDGLTGSSKTAIKYYGTTGTKSAIVTVTSADGQTGTEACSNSVTVGRNYVAPAPTYRQPVPAQQPAASANGQAAASFFSLQGVPWGWIAVLVILVLFATVMYMVFNKPKI